MDYITDSVPGRHWLALILALLVLVALAGCGGGGGGGQPPRIEPGEPVVIRADTLYGYYADGGKDLLETHAHVNLAWTMGWGEGDYLQSVTAQITRALALGVPNVVLGLPTGTHGDVGLARSILEQMHAQGLLAPVVALYPQDEPELHGISAEKVREFNAALRVVLATLGRGDIKLAVIYTGSPAHPGIETYDWVGFDDYNYGAGIFTNGQYDLLKAKLRPDQRILLVPGGSSPWEQDPEPFFAVAVKDPQVIGIIPFVWWDNADSGVGKGIRSNPARKAYCTVGTRIKTLNPNASCP